MCDSSYTNTLSVNDVENTVRFDEQDLGVKHLSLNAATQQCVSANAKLDCEILLVEANRSMPVSTSEEAACLSTDWNEMDVIFGFSQGGFAKFAATHGTTRPGFAVGPPRIKGGESNAANSIANGRCGGELWVE